jgi:glycosyltransferase involved in cell wall biosynthesis
MFNETGDFPLVSVIVLTYNSGRYVLKTLESAKIQTYKNIELIVSDDGSSDNTLDICRNWIAENSGRFLRIELHSVMKNTGIPANCNRGIFSANGDWLKLIAGDDILLGDCIENNVKFIKENSGISFLFSNGFTIDETGQRLGKITSDSKKLALDSRKQYKELLKSAFLLTPSAFIKKDSIIALGGYDEKIPMMEDYPMWLKAVRNGNKLYHLNRETVLYRKHAGSISGNKNKTRDEIRSMEMITNLYDNQMIGDILRFKLYGLYFHIKFVNRAYNAFIKNKKFKFYCYSFLRYFIPSFLFKSIINKVKVVIS